MHLIQSRLGRTNEDIVNKQEKVGTKIFTKELFIYSVHRKASRVLDNIQKRRGKGLETVGEIGLLQEPCCHVSFRNLISDL